MNKTSILLGLTAVVIAGAVLTPRAALAYRGNPAVKGPNYTEERHTAMEKAFENKDYNAWKTLMAGKGRVTQVVNAENFAKFAEAHELAQQGKTDEAKKIRAELGLGQGMGYGRTNR
ncbi:MAG: hypothetical protein L0Y76_00005 [Ignavibacteria bacterium]|nr:hypothetical protein [Ignavibacteria bacterium]